MKQEISDLIDGELNAAECEATISKLVSNQDTQRDWQLLCQMRSVLRGDYIKDADLNLSLGKKIALALEDEPKILAPNNLMASVIDTFSHDVVERVSLSHKKAPLVAVLALAASFFALTLLNLNPFSTDPDADKVISGSTSEFNISDAKFLAAEQELQALVVAHGEFSSMAGLNGLAAYAKIVNADGAQ